MSDNYYAQLQQERSNREQAEYDAVVNASGAAQSDASLAQQQLENAWRIGDMTAAAEAQRAISRAEGRLVQLETGRDAWNERRTQQQATGTVYPQQQQQTQQQSPEQLINSMPLLPEEREWLLARKHLVTNADSVQDLQSAYRASQRAGLARGSREYLDFIAERTGTTSIHGLTRRNRITPAIAGSTSPSMRSNSAR